MNKRRIKTIISIVIVVFVLICLIPIPKHVEKDYYAVDIRAVNEIMTKK